MNLESAFPYAKIWVVVVVLSMDFVLSALRNDCASSA